MGHAAHFFYQNEKSGKHSVAWEMAASQLGKCSASTKSTLKNTSTCKHQNVKAMDKKKQNMNKHIIYAKQANNNDHLQGEIILDSRLPKHWD